MQDIFLTKTYLGNRPKRKENYLKIPLVINSAIFIVSHAVILLFLKNHLSSLLTKTFLGPLPIKRNKVFWIYSIDHLEYTACQVVILLFLKNPKRYLSYVLTKNFIWSFHFWESPTNYNLYWRIVLWYIITANMDMLYQLT